MDIPIYYEGLVRNISADNGHVTLLLSNDQNGDWYDIYYYGEIAEYGWIGETDEAPELIVAKSIKSGNEIVLFDGAIHGYNNLFVYAHSKDKLSNRKLAKLNSQSSKVKIIVEYSIDYESEKDGYDFSDENNLALIDGRIMSWDDVKRNGISWIWITLIDKDNGELCIMDNELA